MKTSDRSRNILFMNDESYSDYVRFKLKERQQNCSIISETKVRLFNVFYKQKIRQKIIIRFYSCSSIPSGATNFHTSLLSSAFPDLPLLYFSHLFHFLPLLSLSLPYRFVSGGYFHSPFFSSLGPHPPPPIICHTFFFSASFDIPSLHLPLFSSLLLSILPHFICQSLSSLLLSISPPFNCHSLYFSDSLDISSLHLPLSFLVCFSRSLPASFATLFASLDVSSLQLLHALCFSQWLIASFATLFSYLLLSIPPPFICYSLCFTRYILSSFTSHFSFCFSRYLLFLFATLFFYFVSLNIASLYSPLSFLFSFFRYFLYSFNNLFFPTSLDISSLYLLLSFLLRFSRYLLSSFATLFSSLLLRISPHFICHSFFPSLLLSIAPSPVFSLISSLLLWRFFPLVPLSFVTRLAIF